MLHLIKLCVGVDSLEDLRDWQKRRLAEKKKKGQKPAPVLQKVFSMTLILVNFSYSYVEWIGARLSSRSNRENILQGSQNLARVL